MPVRIVVHLAPANGRSLALPPHTGPAVYYALLNMLRASSVGGLWASVVHDAPRYKQVAVTPLLDDRDRVATDGSGSVRFEVGVLTDELTAPLLVALKEAATVRIARCHCRIADVELAEVALYPQMVDDADRAAHMWSVRLVTPVAFESAREEGARRLRTLPEPEWVFGSLYARWRHLAGPDLLPAVVEQAIASRLEVADWSLSRGEHLVLPASPERGNKELVWRGSVGTVTYRLVGAGGADGAVRAGLDALVRFASFAGVGDRTNVGMGVVRRGPAPAEQGDHHAGS